MKFSTNFVAMLSLVGRIKFSLNCHPALELRDITHVQCTYTHLFTGQISKLGLHPLQSYGCIPITSWITLVTLFVMTHFGSVLDPKWSLRTDFHNTTIHFTLDTNTIWIAKTEIDFDPNTIVIKRLRCNSMQVGLRKHNGTPVYRGISLAWYVPRHTCPYRGILVVLFLIIEYLKSPKY